MGKEERGARELPQRVPLTGDEDGAALSQRGRGRRTLIRSVESQMRPIYQSDFLRQLIAGLPRICDPGAYKFTVPGGEPKRKAMTSASFLKSHKTYKPTHVQ